MQITKFLPAVIIIITMAFITGCAASKDYTSKLFTPTAQAATDSTVLAQRFLDLDNVETNKEGWVTTDIIMGRDTLSETLALDNLSKTFPAVATADNSKKKNINKTTTVTKEKNPPIEENETVVKNNNSGEIRSKKTRDE